MIKVENVIKQYGQQNAIDDVSFEIGHDEVVGFLGPNGAGKSTMMKILTGYVSASSGKVWVDGLLVETDNPNTKELIGYLPENNPLYHDMYVREYLDFVCGFYTSVTNKKQTIARIVEMTGLGQEQHKKIGALSKGYRQRVGLAQAIIPDPKVLILDEPTTGLDPNQVVDVRQLIIDLGREKTVILSSHIMQEVQAMCQSAIILDRGKIKAHAPVADLAQQVMGIRVVEIEFLQSSIPEGLFDHSSIKEVEQLSSSKFKVMSDGMDIRPILFQQSVNAGLVIIGMEEKGGSLEDVFRAITV